MKLVAWSELIFVGKVKEKERALQSSWGHDQLESHSRRNEGEVLVRGRAVGVAIQGRQDRALSWRVGNSLKTFARAVLSADESS